MIDYKIILQDTQDTHALIIIFPRSFISNLEISFSTDFDSQCLKIHFLTLLEYSKPKILFLTIRMLKPENFISDQIGCYKHEIPYSTWILKIRNCISDKLGCSNDSSKFNV